MKLFSLAVFLSAFYGMTDILFSQENSKWNPIQYIEGQWKHRTIDNKGSDVFDPRLIKYVRLESNNSLYADGGKVSIIYKWDARSKCLLKIELSFSFGKPKISSEVGLYDPIKRQVEWRVGSKRGVKKCIWRLQGDSKIIIEMDKAWVSAKRKEYEKSPIPRDLPTQERRVYIMEKMP